MVRICSCVLLLGTLLAGCASIHKSHYITPPKKNPTESMTPSDPILTDEATNEEESSESSTEMTIEENVDSRENIEEVKPQEKQEETESIDENVRETGFQQGGIELPDDIWGK